MPRSVGQAAVVAVPSEFVKATVVDAFGVAPGDGRRGAPRRRRPDFGRRCRRKPSSAAATGSATAGSLVYPADHPPPQGPPVPRRRCWPGRWTDPDLVLVLPGRRRSRRGATCVAAIAGAGVTGRVVRPGRVPAADRDGLIALAEALVFPSEYEGFGAPVLEAMALGTPGGLQRPGCAARGRRRRGGRAAARARRVGRRARPSSPPTAPAWSPGAVVGPPCSPPPRRAPPLAAAYRRALAGGGPD